MGLAYILVGILSAAVAVFSLQNTQPMPLRFVVWSLDGVPLAGAILAALATGLVLAAVPLSIELWRARATFTGAAIGPTATLGVQTKTFTEAQAAGIGRGAPSVLFGAGEVGKLPLESSERSC